MRDVSVREGIIPLGAFKARASRLLRELEGSDQPLVTTQNGKPAAVVMSPSAFEELREEQRFLEALAAGVADGERTAGTEPPRLLALAPNPALGEIRVSFQVPRPSRVSLTVHSVDGRRLGTIIDKTVTPGLHTVCWDGNRIGGRAAAPGVYFVRMEAAGHSLTRKVVLLK